MADPLSEVVSLLQPSATVSKVVSGAGSWRLRRIDAGRPFYCAILDGACCLAVDGHAAITLEANDFALIPAAHGFTTSSLGDSVNPAAANDGNTPPIALPDGQFRIGNPTGPPDVMLLVGHCAFASPDATLLVSLLPQLVHVRGERRLVTLVQLLGEESRNQRPAREVVLSRLLEILFIEALRSDAGTTTSPGLARGLADCRLAVALRSMHENPTRAWTVAQLAEEAALSRSAFFERFSRAIGVAPMAYLLTWRMALAKNLLRKQESSVAAVAERVGYGSASAFSVAFTRHVGLPPTRYAREQTQA